MVQYAMWPVLPSAFGVHEFVSSPHLGRFCVPNGAVGGLFRLFVLFDEQREPPSAMQKEGSCREKRRPVSWTRAASPFSRGGKLII